MEPATASPGIDQHGRVLRRTLGPTTRGPQEVASRGSLLAEMCQIARSRSVDVEDLFITCIDSRGEVSARVSGQSEAVLIITANRRSISCPSLMGGRCAEMAGEMAVIETAVIILASVWAGVA